jgi:hypothetical protein
MLKLDTWEAFGFYKSFLHWYCNYYKPTYLEIGCQAGDLCASLDTTYAVGIDINTHPDWQTYEKRTEGRAKYFQVSSDDFFASYPYKQFGLIFIDGDHHAEQVRKDVNNSLAFLEQDGLIVMHDTLPPDVASTAENLCGTAFLIAQELRQDRMLEVYTFPVTFGVTLVGKIGSEFPW